MLATFAEQKATITLTQAKPSILGAQETALPTRPSLLLQPIHMSSPSSSPSASRDSSNASIQHNRRLGLILFAIYSLVYLAFTLVNAFLPKVVEWTPMGGINLTTWWGLGLIGLAFLMSLLYGWLCHSDKNDSAEASSKDAAR